MSSLHLATLSRRLDALTETYKQTLQSIHRIPRTPDPEDLADLTSNIRDSLNSLTEDLDLLNLSIEDTGGARPDSEESKQKLQLYVQAQRLSEDIKNARQSFRRTQIYVKKAEDTARRKERDDRLRQLREPPRADTPEGAVQNTTPTSSQILPSRRRKEEKPTEDDILVNASSDVLDALRQTHTLMASELERSQFAQEILNSSTRELEQLNESYTDLDTMLKTSKGLVTQLMKSNKSDTWYLLTARTFLMVVLAWLVWRRLLWGPTWWLVWLPLKVMYMTLMVIMSPFGMGRGVEEAGAISSNFRVMPSASQGPPVVSGGRQAPHIHVGRGGGAPVNDPSADGSLSQKIGKMVEEAEKIVRGDGTELEDSDEPRNPKKRVMDIIDDLEQGKQGEQGEEQDEQPIADDIVVDGGQLRDEL
jgi:protein transport protein SEC20